MALTEAFTFLERQNTTTRHPLRQPQTLIQHPSWPGTAQREACFDASSLPRKSYISLTTCHIG